MSNIKDEVKEIIDQLPDNCTFEDIQYHLYVVEKIRNGIDRGEREDAMSQKEVERKFSKWISD